MTNFDKLKDIKLGDWFKSVNGCDLTLSATVNLMYLETNCNNCPCSDRCGMSKIDSPFACKSVFQEWLLADSGVE